MASFTCSLCFYNRDFRSFVKLFRHVGTFHRSDPSFQVTCNLSSSCGISYKSYAAYKAHVYRYHFDLLQTAPIDSTGSSSFEDNEIFIPSTDDVNDHDTEEESNEEDRIFADFASSHDNENIEGATTLADIKRIYVRFLIQLREEFLLPKTIISVISSNIVCLLESLDSLLQQQRFPFTPEATTTMASERTKHVIESDVITTTVRDMSRTIEATTRSEHEFVHLCRRIMKYETPNEIILSDPGDRPECGYFVPVSRTLSLLFHHPQILPLVSRNLKCQRKCAANDDDLMFSLREGNFGMRIDDESLLIQLYIDDIGLTNPIGPRKDRHKMTMVYFLLEDMPDKHRSQVQSINLLAICPRDSLKVREMFFVHLTVFSFFRSEGPTQVKAFFPTDHRRSKRLARAWPKHRW